MPGKEFGETIGTLFSEISGMTNFALLSVSYDNLILATNNGSLYYINDLENGLFIFASERHILEELQKKNKLHLSMHSIIQLNPGCLVSVNLKSLSFQLAKIGDILINLELNPDSAEICLLKDTNPIKDIYINTSLEHKLTDVNLRFIDEYERRKDGIYKLRRCTKCLLPETFPL